MRAGPTAVSTGLERSSLYAAVCPQAHARLRCWGGRPKLQQLTERRGSRPMQGGRHGHLDGFQVQAATVTAIVEDHAQKLVYFLRDLLLDRVPRFFSCAVGASSSTGRRRQICSLTSTNS